MPATYHAAEAPGPGRATIAAVLLTVAGLPRFVERLSRALTSAGYPVVALDSDGPHATADALVDHVGAAAAALRERAGAERLVLIADCALAAAVGRAAGAAGIDGIVLVSPRLPDEAKPADLDVFDALEPFAGALLVLGAGDTVDQGPETIALAARANSWRHGAEHRHLELGMVDGPRALLPVDNDHVLAPAAYVGIVAEQTAQWIERRFGPGYPPAWQGPPPTLTLAPSNRDGGDEAKVPLLATGANIVPVRDDPAAPPWRLELPDGRAFSLSEALYRLVALVDGHRSVGEIAARLSSAMGREVSVAQVSRLLHERLEPLGVLVPDSRGEGGEVESGMTDILIRCYEPHDRLRELLDNLTKVTRSPYNLLLIVGKRHAVLNQNVGLERARTKYAVFLDDDVLLTEGWLERLRETMDRTGAGAVSARQLRMDGSPLSTANASENGNIVEVLSGGACFMFRTDVVPRFDETYVRSQWDDVDFMFHLFEQGYRAYVDGRVDFYHHNDPKVWRGQNLCHFVEKWTNKGLLRGWCLYSYTSGSAYMPCFGPLDES